MLLSSIFFFVSLSLKALATIFLEQARKRQRTCRAGCTVLLPTAVYLRKYTKPLVSRLQTTSSCRLLNVFAKQKYFGDTNARI
jgi:hypothetical protein